MTAFTPNSTFTTVEGDFRYERKERATVEDLAGPPAKAPFTTGTFGYRHPARDVAEGFGERTSASTREIQGKAPDHAVAKKQGTKTFRSLYPSRDVQRSPTEGSFASAQKANRRPQTQTAPTTTARPAIAQARETNINGTYIIWYALP